MPNLPFRRLPVGARKNVGTRRKFKRSRVGNPRNGRLGSLRYNYASPHPSSKKKLAARGGLNYKVEMASKKNQKPHPGSGSHSPGESTPEAQPELTGARSATVDNSLLPVIRVLLAGAAVMAAYLAWNAWSGGSLPGCGPASGCDKVLQSRWAYWMGIPVSVPAFLIYLGLLIETFSLRGNVPPERERRAWMVIVTLSVLVIGAALWFVGLQVFLLKSFCKFCLTAHGCGLLASVLLLAKTPGEPESMSRRKAADAIGIPPRLKAGLGALGVFSLLVLVLGQALVERPGSAVKTALQAGAVETNRPPGPSPAIESPAKVFKATAVESAVTATTVSDPTLAPSPERTTNPIPSVAPAVSQSDANQPPGRALLLHGGKFQLKVNELPLIGSAQASNVIVSLFDYTCHYCRDLHGLLVEAQNHFSNQLAIVSLPMPLDGACNHLVSRTQSAHQQACQYAALGLAVWRAQPEAFHKFDAWVFTSPSPPPIREVKSYADQLVGREKLEQALTDNWVANQIQTDISIYEANWRQLNDGRMPQLIIGATVNAGPISRVDELYQLLSDHLGLK